MRCPGLNIDNEGLYPARIVVVPAGVTVLLGLCNPPHGGVNSRPILGRSDEYIPLCGFLVVVHST
jgi:hypothetical protein